MAWGEGIDTLSRLSFPFPPPTERLADRSAFRNENNDQEAWIMAADRTTYSLKDEYGERTTITLSKWIADALQANLPNVHEWLQVEYNKIVERFPWLTRREKGDKVRMIAFNTAAIYLDDEDLK